MSDSLAGANERVAGGMSELASGGGTLTWRDYIVADGRLVAVRFCTGSAPCASSGATMKYIVGDHLGSVTMVLNSDGTAAEHQSYDAWGMRRNADGSPASCGAISSSTTRGYTGQEEMDGLCLVNMNARLYDPELGRFMSADTIVPDPFDMQSFNRYSYVLNNPLEYTDPTGHIETVVVIAYRIVVKAIMGDVGGMSPFSDSDLASHGGDRDHSGEMKGKSKDEKNGKSGICDVSSGTFNPFAKPTNLPPGWKVYDAGGGQTDVYMQNSEGALSFTPDYAAAAKQSYSTMMRANSRTADETYALGLGGFFATPIGVIAAIAGLVTTANDQSSPPPDAQGCPTSQ